MIEDRTIDDVARRLLEAAPEGSRVILFGSRARGEADERSDADFLVVEPEVASPRSEMVRLRSALRGVPMGVDLVVFSREEFEYWKDTPNTLPYLALKEGRVYEQVA